MKVKDLEEELKRYFAGDPKARPPAHLYRLLEEDELLAYLGHDNWAAVRAEHEKPRT